MRRAVPGVCIDGGGLPPEGGDVALSQTALYVLEQAEDSHAIISVTGEN